MAEPASESTAAPAPDGPDLVPPPREAIIRRTLARIIDLLVAAGLWMLPVVGAVLAIAWLLFADALMDGGSLGKRSLGLRVLDRKTRARASVRHSVVRNLPFAVPLALTFVGWLGGVLAMVTAGVVLVFETWLAWVEPGGVRVGDIFADTLVVDEQESP